MTVNRSGVRPLTSDETLLLTYWRERALALMPYMANILYGLRPVSAPGLGTMAVDEQMRLYVDFDTAQAKGEVWSAEGLLHECGHVFGLHSDRARDKGVPQTTQARRDWNCACFPAATLLPSGRPIEDVANMVNDFDGHLVVLDTQAGAVEATPDHPFFVRRRRHAKRLHPIVLHEPEWVSAGDLTDSDYVLVPVLTEKRADTWIDLCGHAIKHVRRTTTVERISNRTVRRIPLDTDTAWLIGLYVAEGSSSPSVRFSLGITETEYAERIARIAQRIGYSASVRLNVPGNSMAVNLGAVVLGRWLKEHCGPGAHQKKIPEVILHHSNPAIRAAFIEGLVDGDGYRAQRANGPKYIVATSSRALMHDLVLLLAQDGIGGSTQIQAQRAGRALGRHLLPAGTLYKMEWNPEGSRRTDRVLNGKAIISYNHRWKSDEHGVWYPVRSVGRRPFTGKVYNLTTPSHTYVVHGMLVHNCDASVNDDLVAAGLSLTPEDPMPHMLGEPDHQTAEHYYDVIVKARQGSGQQSCGTCGQAQGQGGQDQHGQDQRGQDQRGQQDAEQAKQPGHQGPRQDQRCPECGGQVQFVGCGSGAGGQPGDFELGGDDLGGTAAPMDEVDRELMVLATAQDVLDSAKSRGSVPGGLTQQAQMLVRPSKVPWRTLLAGAVRRSVRAGTGSDRRTYNRVHRRRCHVRVGGRKVVYPGRYTPRPSIAVVRDTSGSMSERDLQAATSEIVAIAARLRINGPDLRILDVDAAVHTVRGYTGARTLAEVTGRGGTDMCVGIAAAIDLHPRPSTVVVVTDGGTPWPDARPEVPVVAALVGTGARECAASVPEWATLVLIDDTSDDRA